MPNFMEPGATLSMPLVVVAVPLRATATDGSDAFEVIARLAVSVPDLVGENVTDRVALEPAGRE